MTSFIVYTDSNHAQSSKALSDIQNSPDRTPSDSQNHPNIQPLSDIQNSPDRTPSDSQIRKAFQNGKFFAYTVDFLHIQNLSIAALFLI